MSSQLLISVYTPTITYFFPFRPRWHLSNLLQRMVACHNLHVTSRHPLPSNIDSFRDVQAISEYNWPGFEYNSYTGVKHAKPHSKLLP